MSELLTNFGIDWKLLLAQVVNFLVLLVVLKKFAYKPLLNVLRRRQEEIKRGLEASQESQERLSNIKIVEQEKLDEARQKALAIVTEAAVTARSEREGILAEASKKSESLVEEARGKINQAKQTMLAEVEGEATHILTLGVARVLKKMKPDERDAELIKETLRELKTVSIEE